jgi:hypothetical protein
VESVYGDKNMYYNQLNSLIKAVKNKKITTMAKRTPNVVVAVTAAV